MADKIIKIDCCKNCPYCKTVPSSYVWNFSSDVSCILAKRDIIKKTDLRFNGILEQMPDWCPLEDDKY